MNNAKPFKNYLLNTRMASVGAFISRLCFSLLFFSTLNKNKDYLGFDNLGYKDVLLMVKGGKSIKKT